MHIRSSVRAPSAIRGSGWLLAAALLVGLRLAHLGGPIDDPHSWRQCDTAHYSLDFARNGIDVLLPAVSWLGPHRTLVLEFPLPEAISALLHRALGANVAWDRLVSLAFFIVAAAYFHALANRVAPPRVARLATLSYLALPLGQFYSRAAHVDFAATAFVHAFLLHAVAGIERRSVGQVCVAAACGTLAALIKAPYLLPVLGPLALAALTAPAWSALALGALSLAVPAAAFVLWRRYSDAVNGSAPGWTFLPGYYRESDAMWWYVGSWAQRLDPHAWFTVIRRVVRAVTTPLGVPLALAGLAWRDPDSRPADRAGAGRSPRALAFAAAWGAGALAYVAVFFPLNVIHDYYQIPLLAPAALAIGLGADLAWRRLPPVRGLPLGALAFAVFLAGAVWMVKPLGYYRVDWLRVEAGREIGRVVPAGDLVVVGDHGSAYSDPRLLVRADREGWPLAVADFTPQRLDTLAALGGRWAAVVTDPGDPALGPPAFLAPMLVEKRPLDHDGRLLGTLYVYRLDRACLRGEAGRP